MNDKYSFQSLRQLVVDSVLPRFAFNKSIFPKCHGDEELLQQWKTAAFEKCMTETELSIKMDPQLIALFSSNIVTHNLEGIPRPFASDGNNLLVHVPSFLQSCNFHDNINLAVSDLLLQGVQQHVLVSLTGQGEIAVSSEHLIEQSIAQHPNLKWDEQTMRDMLGTPDAARLRTLSSFALFCDPSKAIQYAGHVIDEENLKETSPPSDLSVATKAWNPIANFLLACDPISRTPQDLEYQWFAQMFDTGLKHLKGFESENHKWAWALMFGNAQKSKPSMNLGQALINGFRSQEEKIKPIIHDISAGMDAAASINLLVNGKNHVGNEASKFFNSLMHAQSIVDLLNTLHEQSHVSSNPYVRPNIQQLIDIHQKAFSVLDANDFKSNPNLIAKALLFSPRNGLDIQSQYTDNQWADINQKIISNYCTIANHHISILFNNFVSEQNKGKSVDAINFLSSSLLKLPMQYSKNQSKMLSEISDRLNVFAEDQKGQQYYGDLLGAIRFIDSALSSHTISGELRIHSSSGLSEAVHEKPKKRM